MLRQWGFECDYTLCADAKGLREGVVRKRRVLVEGVQLEVEGVSTASQDAVVRQVESGVEALGNTYARPAGEVPRLDMWVVLWEVVEAVLHAERQKSW